MVVVSLVLFVVVAIYWHKINKEQNMSNQYYDNDDLEIEVGEATYTVKVHAEGTYSYSPATRWEPEDSDFEIEDVDATWFDENGEVIEATDEMNKALDDYLYNKVDWEVSEPPEPDYDYYEEREMERWEAELDRYDL